ncbi:MAG TPA: hypothetical protein VF203_07760 [Burkholderiales bacterium]
MQYDWLFPAVSIVFVASVAICSLLEHLGLWSRIEERMEENRLSGSLLKIGFGIAAMAGMFAIVPVGLAVFFAIGDLIEELARELGIYEVTATFYVVAPIIAWGWMYLDKKVRADEEQKRWANEHAKYVARLEEEIERLKRKLGETT